MSMREITSFRGYLSPGFVYEGERVGVDLGNGNIREIPSNKVNEVLTRATLPTGEGCFILQKETPISRLPIVVIGKPSNT